MIEADENLLKVIKAEVKDGRLVVGLESGKKIGRTSDAEIDDRERRSSMRSSPAVASRVVATVVEGPRFRVDVDRRGSSKRSKG